MATLTFTPQKVRLANTHNALSRTRPLGGTAGVGEAATMDALGNWIVQAGSGRTYGIILGITDGRLEGNVGDDAEVLMEGIVAGYDVEPGALVSDAGDGTLEDSGGGQNIGVGLNDSLLYIRPDLQ